MKLAILRRVPIRRIAIGIVALCALAVIGFELTPARAFVDPARFVRPRDAFEVVDRHGRVLRHARVDGMDRRWVPLAEISPVLVDAVIATEDGRFREHHGVDFLATGRAALAYAVPWTARRGASTITQQLVKRVYGREHGALSKIVEIVRAAALERIFDKNEILEQYLNRVPFGDRIEGVGRASEEYFGHPVSSLSVGEAALLAGIPQAPTATEPRRHLERAVKRRDHVLSRMVAFGSIDDATRARAAAESPLIRALPPRPNGAPRFVDAALARWKDGRLERAGGALATSLDLDLEERADEVLAMTVSRFEPRGVTNAAAVVIANATGEILAYSGGARRGPDAPGGTLDLLARRRQPGSTLKPFAYELFFERGGTAASVLDDIAIARTGAHGAIFDAKDYDGRERGPVRARVALSASLNLAALDASGRVGQDALLARLGALGFDDTSSPDRYGAAAVLGGLDVSPLDLATAYVTLARGGTRIPLVFAPARAIATGDRVMNADAAEVARDVLFDSAARADAFGADLVDLAGGERFGLKTGTSSGWRDAWAAAFTDAITVVVWAGDPDGRALGAVSGFEAAAPAAARILAAARQRAASDGVIAAERPPVRLVPISVCATSGLRPGPRCHHVVEERFAPGTIPAESCDAHDDAGDAVLPARYADWIRRVHPPGVARVAAAPTGDLAVLEPRDGARWLIDASRGTSSASLRATAGGVEIAGVTWEVDGAKLAGPSWPIAPGDHVVVALDDQGHRSPPARLHVERR